MSGRCQVMRCKSSDELQICKKTQNDLENSWEFQQGQKNYKYSWWSFSEDLLLVNYRNRKWSQSEISLIWIFEAFSTYFFPLSIRLIEFVVVWFNTSFFTSIKLIKSFVVRFYALVWTMKSVKYSSVSELKLIRNLSGAGIEQVIWV